MYMKRYSLMETVSNGFSIADGSNHSAGAGLLIHKLKVNDFSSFNKAGKISHYAPR